jgi:hypothetical protein
LENRPNRYDQEGEEEDIIIQREKRRSNRKQTCSIFNMTVHTSQIEGVGSNLSKDGAYFVTCDEIPVELVILGEHEKRSVHGRIVRIDRISEGSQGMAIRFDARLLDI